MHKGARIREHAMRIRAKYDFKILASRETQHNGDTFAFAVSS